MRQIVLDTETTGLNPAEGHRIIEIGCVELVERRLTGNRFQQYLQPDREIEDGALAVHGISAKFLADKPRFGDIVSDLLAFMRGAELIIHNAPFDVGFLDAELERLDGSWGRITDHCSVLDTLVLARDLHPGQKNTLDALCKRYGVDNSQRDLHGALLDAEILAEVYLAMTGGQATLSLGADREPPGRMSATSAKRRKRGVQVGLLRVQAATGEENAAHAAYLRRLQEASKGECLWLQLEAGGSPSADNER